MQFGQQGSHAFETILEPRNGPSQVAGGQKQQLWEQLHTAWIGLDVEPAAVLLPNPMGSAGEHRNRQ